MPSTETAQRTVTLDVRGQSCPMPVVRAAQAIRDLAAGDVLEILSTDRGSWSDIPTWAGTTGNELLERAEEDGVFRYLVRRTGGEGR
ncbi:MAG: sulfurtransferase TusA family protein [Actinobacteria bacterium]|nr:sulfurtransferase TusA family protein [Actinomycetota bacterium]